VTTPKTTPNRLTPEVVTKLCEAIASGLNRQHAAQQAGIGGRTLYRWLKRGRRRETPELVALVAAVKKAESEAVKKHIGNISTAANNGTWQASAWWLERNHPQHYAINRREIRELAKQLEELEQRTRSIPTWRHRKRARRTPPSAN